MARAEFPSREHWRVAIMRRLAGEGLLPIWPGRVDSWRSADSLRQTAVAFLVRSRGKPAVEVVEDRFDGWTQLVGGPASVMMIWNRPASAISMAGVVPDDPSGHPHRSAGR
jgi:hypothetical protein